MFIIYFFIIDYIYCYNSCSTFILLISIINGYVILFYSSQLTHYNMFVCRWANPGFDFLSLALESTITRNLTDEEFEVKVIQKILSITRGNS